MIPEGMKELEGVTTFVSEKEVMIQSDEGEVLFRFPLKPKCVRCHDIGMVHHMTKEEPLAGYESIMGMRTVIRSIPCPACQPDTLPS